MDHADPGSAPLPERFRDYLLLLARSSLGRQERAGLAPSDVVQQTLPEAHRKRDQFRRRSDAELAGWLGPVWYAQDTPGGRVLLRIGSGAWPDRLRCLDGATGEEVWSLPLAGEVPVLVASPDGGRFAFAEDRPGGQAGLGVRDLGTGAVVSTLPREEVSTSLLGGAVAFTPDGARLAAGRADGSIRLWDANAGTELLTLRGHKGHVLSLAFTADGAKLLSVGDDEEARVWDATPVPAR